MRWLWVSETDIIMLMISSKNFGSVSLRSRCYSIVYLDFLLGFYRSLAVISIILTFNVFNNVVAFTISFLYSSISCLDDFFFFSIFSSSCSYLCNAPSFSDATLVMLSWSCEAKVASLSAMTLSFVISSCMPPSSLPVRKGRTEWTSWCERQGVNRQYIYWVDRWSGPGFTTDHWVSGRWNC